MRVPGSPQDYRVLRAQPWAAPLIARTTHLRVWVDWTVVQPRGDLALDDPENPGLPHLAAVDAQVAAAAADGLQVIVLPYRYPRWVTRTTRSDGTKSAAYRLPGRRATARTARGRASSRRCGSATPAGWRASRWSTSPTSSCGRRRDVAERVAWMIATVDAIARRHDHAATCLAPSVSDAESDRPWRITEREPFVEALLPALERRGFAGGRHWVWSFHNYNDCELGGSRVGAMRAQLAGRWRGRTAADGGPVVYATEGGVRLVGVERRTGVVHRRSAGARSRRACWRTPWRATSARPASGCSPSKPSTPTELRLRAARARRGHAPGVRRVGCGVAVRRVRLSRAGSDLEEPQHAHADLHLVAVVQLGLLHAQAVERTRPLRLRSSAITGAPPRSSSSACRRDTELSSSTMSAGGAAADPGDAAEREATHFVTRHGDKPGSGRGQSSPDERVRTSQRYRSAPGRMVGRRAVKRRRRGGRRSWRLMATEQGSTASSEVLV
jgi:hypothetical protein